MKLISACLLGINCKYNGKNNCKSWINDCSNEFVPVCPEQLGGLSTPRSPAEIKGGDGTDVLVGKARVVTKESRDVTRNFINGAKATLQIANLVGAKEAIFKERSPSCGCRTIYDGNFSRRIISGQGVTTAFLTQNGITVYSDEDFTP